MTDVEPVTANLSEALTWTQICERYPDQWVVLVDDDWLEKGEDALHFESLRSARVIGHHRSINEALKQCSWSPDPLVACVHTGGRKLRFLRIELTDEIRDIIRTRR